MAPAESTLASYTGPRPDVLALAPEGACRILDVGCSDGTLGASLSGIGVEVVGIEHDSALAARARKRLSEVFQGDATEALRSLSDESFDLVLCADILEHLPDPWATMREVRRVLTSGGACVVSLPNVRFWTTFTQLGLHGRWPRKDRGVHDRTHLSWFTDRDARQLFSETGFSVTDYAANHRLSDDPSRRLNRLARYVARGPVGPFVTYQNLYRLEAF